MTRVTIAGPARKLLRVRAQEARVMKVEGLFSFQGPAHTMQVVFELPETGRRMIVRFDRAAWDELCDRVARACVFEE